MPKKKSDKATDQLAGTLGLDDTSDVEKIPLTMGEVIKTPSKASKALKKSKSSSKSSKSILTDGETSRHKKIKSKKPERTKSLTSVSSRASSRESSKSSSKRSSKHNNKPSKSGLSSRHSRGSIHSAPLDAVAEFGDGTEEDGELESPERSYHKPKSYKKHSKSKKKKKSKSVKELLVVNDNTSIRQESMVSLGLPFEEVDYDDGQRPAEGDDDIDIDDVEDENDNHRDTDDDEEEILEIRPSSHGRWSSNLADDIDDCTDIRESQLIVDTPPIDEIVAAQTDDDDVSDIGEAVLDAAMDPEIVDGVEIIFNPLDDDVCFDDRGHPGTTDLIGVLKDLLIEFEGTEYSPPVYKAIKKRLKGRKFLIRIRRDERTSWREATKPEVIQLLGDCFNEERRRQKEGITDDDSEIDSSLQDSAQQPSENSLDLVDDENLISPGTPSRNGTPRHSNMNPAPLPRRTDSIQSKRPSSKRLDSKVSSASGGSAAGRNHHHLGSQVHSSLDLAMKECKIAQDFAKPFDNIDKMQQGIAAEEKLAKLIGMADVPKTEALKVELETLQQMVNRMKYFSLAPMLEMMEKIEGCITGYLQDFSQHAGESAEEIDCSTSRREKEGTERSSDRDSGNGIRHRRSITVSSDTGHDREDAEVNSVSLNERHEEENIFDDSHLSIPLKGGDESSNLEHSLSKSNRFDRSEGSLSNVNALDKSYQSAFDKSYEQAGETYTMAMNNGSYIEGESSGDIGFDDSRKAFDDSRRTNKSSLPGVDEGEDESAEEYDEVEEVQNVGDDEEEYLDYEEEEADLESSQPNVDDGHLLELEAKVDDMSSVGRSMHDGSDSEDDEDMEEIEIQADDDMDDEKGSQSSDSDMSNVTPPPVKPKSIFEKPNPKIGQFFDRLQHLFEVRRKTEEKAAAMDPSSKFRSLKVKVHSGGIHRKNGEFKEEYQQHNVDDQLVQNLDELYAAAESAKTELKFFLNQMIQEVKGLESQDLFIAPLKPRDRAFEKAKSEYRRRNPGPPESWLYDIVRAGIICKSYKQMSDVNKWLGKNCHVVQAKNRFAEPCFNGYRDLLFHVSIPFRDELAHICEIQVHHKDMLALNEQYGLPKHYEFFRSCFVSSRRSREEILEDLAMMSRFGKVEGPCMKKLLKSKDLEQIQLVAGLCRDKLDDFTRALELYRRILNLQENDLESGDEEMAETFMSIGRVQGSMGDTNASLKNLQKALAIQELCLGVHHVEVADTYAEIGRLLIKKGDFSGALFQYQRSLVIRERKLGKDHFLVIKSLQDIGYALQEKGDFRESVEEYKRALKLQEDILGDIHPDVAATHAMIGNALCQHGEFGKAMEEYRLALSIRETELGKNNPVTAQSHTDIGILLCQKGDYEFSEWRHRKALRIREATRGKDDEECAISHGYLGEVLSRKGDFEGAVAELKRAQEIREANVGMDSPITAGSYIDLGNIFCRHGKYSEALTEYRRAKVIRESILGPKHPDTALAYMYMGRTLALQGDLLRALSEHRKALAVFESVLGKCHPRTATAYQFMADAFLANGERDEALIEHRKALAIRANVLGKDHPDTATSCSRIGDLLSGKGDLVGALVAYRQALAITAGLYGEDHVETAAAHINVGRILAAQGDLDEAMDEIQHAISSRQRSLGEGHEATAKAYQMLGTLHSMQGEFEEAQEYHSKAVESFTKKFGKKHPETKLARKKLAMADAEEQESDFSDSQDNYFND
ncbi:expressed tetratricopeptide repeat protein [Nitzschia inconspicua]|uniref:Expressed tetratricopeptide repeat protein n=1 Tax=Nitzschia inconspicua TaxID=303405 RepID=A0A9K3PU48_9STRA|nr:expressed tetratricopeptide repeat protein [Nitzschia inconspicua]